jgi:hypothetical protein
MTQWEEAKIKFEHCSFIAGLKAHNMNKDFIPTNTIHLYGINPVTVVQTNKYYEMTNQ